MLMVWSVSRPPCSAGGDELIAPRPGILLNKSQEAREGHNQFGPRREIVELYDRLRPSLYQYLVCLGLRPHEADDIIQETFLRLFRYQARGGTVENPRSWLFRVAHNLSLDAQKAHRQMIAEAETASSEKPDPGLNPEELLLQKEQLLRLHSAMSQLTERQRQFLHLRAEGLRYREIAEVLATTVSNVNETLRRAIVRIMEQLYE